MTTVKAVIFDVDGTLLNTFEHIVQAFEKVLPEHDVEPDREVIRALIGKTLVECYEALVSADKVHAAATRHHEIQQTPEMYDLIEAYDGLRETLDTLQRSGIKCGVVTNRGQSSLGLIFKHVGIADDFEAAVTPNDIARPKPDPEGLLLAIKRLGVSPETTIIVGDTYIDVETGKNAGVLATVGVTHGFGKRIDLEVSGADYIIDSLGELPAAIQKIEQSAVAAPQA